MLDLANGYTLTLGAADVQDVRQAVVPLLVPGEAVVASFAGAHDGVVFTDKRLVAVTPHGITGRKRDITSLPYRTVQAFSIETSSTFDVDSGLDLWFSGLSGTLSLRFQDGADVRRLATLIATAVL